MKQATQFEAAFVRWLSLLKAEQAWKEGNRNPLEQLLDQKEDERCNCSTRGAEVWCCEGKCQKVCGECGHA